MRNKLVRQDSKAELRRSPCVIGPDLLLFFPHRVPRALGIPRRGSRIRRNLLGRLDTYAERASHELVRPEADVKTVLHDEVYVKRVHFKTLDHIQSLVIGLNGPSLEPSLPLVTFYLPTCST